MSALPKLPATKRSEAMALIRRRYQIAKEIARLEAEKRQLPTNKEIAAQLNVGCELLRRIARGYEYVNQHPDDLNVQT